MNKSISSGFVNVDMITGGFYPSEVTVIGARPAVGKTAFLTSIINHVCLNEKVPAVYFSLEMNKEQSQNRLLSQLTGIENKRLRAGILYSAQQEKLKEAIESLNEASLIVDDTPGLKIEELCNKAKQYVEEASAKIIFIDYIGLISTKNEAAPVFEQQSEIIKKLKFLAKELNIPVVITCQLARAEERPCLKQLRGTGLIEDVADVIILLHREIEPEQSENAMAIIAKNNNGPTETTSLKYNPQCCMFLEESSNS